MTLDLEAIESRATLATPAPWSISGASIWSGETHVADFTSNEDALFCARAREDVPALIVELRRLQLDNERLEKLALDTRDEAVGELLHLEAETQDLRDQLADANETIRDLNAQLVSMVEQAQAEAVVVGDDLTAHPGSGRLLGAVPVRKPSE